MPFKFRLEKVLGIRQDELEEAQRALADAFRLVEQAKKNLEEAKRLLKEAHEDMIKQNYEMAEAHLRLIRQREEELKNRELELKQAEDNVVQKRKELLEAKIKVEALEKLKEKKEAEYIEEENRQEQKITDERATLKYVRKMRGEDY